jgi:hypothetical protein
MRRLGIVTACSFPPGFDVVLWLASCARIAAAIVELDSFMADKMNEGLRLFPDAKAL